MPRTGEYAQVAGEYEAEWHQSVFVRVGMAFPPCPQCHASVEYTKVVTSYARCPRGLTPDEAVCPNCGRGVLRVLTFPVGDGTLAFCQPHDPWNPRQECLTRFRYDESHGEGWQVWPVRPEEIDHWRVPEAGALRGSAV